jgi:hypothetical protein
MMDAVVFPRSVSEKFLQKQKQDMENLRTQVENWTALNKVEVS